MAHLGILTVLVSLGQIYHSMSLRAQMLLKGNLEENSLLLKLDRSAQLRFWGHCICHFQKNSFLPQI